MAINLKKSVLEEDIIKEVIQDTNQNKINLVKPEARTNNNQNNKTNLNKPTNTQEQNTNQGLSKIAIKLVHGNDSKKKFSIIPRKIKVDCDLAAIFLKEDDTIIGYNGVDSCVYWGRPNAYDGGVNLTGDGKGNNEMYMEHLFIDTSRLPDEIAKIVVTVSIYLGEFHQLNFGLTNGLTIDVLDVDTQKHLDYLEITNRFQNFSAIKYVELVKVNGNWSMNSINTPIFDVTTIADILEKYI